MKKLFPILIIAAAAIFIAMGLFISQPRLISSKPESTENYFSDGLADILAHDYIKATNDFTISAKMGNADAAFNLGLMSYYGQGVKISYARAFKWTLQAAEEGNVRAQYNVSVLFEDGEGTAQSYNQADFWGNKSASSGYSDRDELSNMYDTGDDNLTKSDVYASAMKWTKLAADRGDPVSAYDLAINYDHPDIYVGTDFRHNPELAFKYCKIAALGGLDDAQAHLASEYQNGSVFRKILSCLICGIQSQTKIRTVPTADPIFKT